MRSFLLLYWSCWLTGLTAVNLDVKRTNSSVVTVSHELIPLLNSSDINSALVKVSNDEQLKTVKNLDEPGAVLWLNDYEFEAQKMYSSSIEAGWIYFNNLTEENRVNLMIAEDSLTQFIKQRAAQAALFPSKSFKDPAVRRKLSKLATSDVVSVLSEEKFRNFTRLQQEIAEIYSTSTVCEAASKPPCTLRLEDLSRIMASSKDYPNLSYFWTAYKNTVGRRLKGKYLELVSLSNDAAKLNGYADTGAAWRSAYETPDIMEQFDRLYTTLKPFYQQLHAYIRRKLNNIYSNYGVIKSDGPIPAHLLGDMWSSTWINLYGHTAPFPGKISVNPTEEMLRQNYTVTKMVSEATKFYKSLGFDNLTESFWRHSIFQSSQPCQPAAVDFRDGKDFRLKMCSEVGADDFIRIHQELAHIYYDMSYRNQSIIFRDGANPAFHDAVGATIALSVQTSDHFQRLQLLPQQDSNQDADVNFLFRTALDRIAFLPFAYLVEKYRWELFSGNISSANSVWWEMSKKYQGVSEPVPRNDTDFDAGSIFHVAYHMPYLKYFISYVTQFQFLKSLCDAAGHKGPLMKCDITGSTAAGAKLRDMMALGASQPWPVAMKVITGQTELRAEPLLKYFQPLHDWLIEENRKSGEFVGWEGPGKPYGSSSFNFSRLSNIPSEFRNFIPKSGVEYLKANQGVGRPCTMSLECTASGTHCNGTNCVCVESTSLWNDLCVPDQNAFNDSLVVRVSKVPDSTPPDATKLTSAVHLSATTSSPKSSANPIDSLGWILVISGIIASTLL